LVTVTCLAYIIVAGTTEVAGYSAQKANLQKQLITRAQSDASILAAGSIVNLQFPNASRSTLDSLVSAFQSAPGVSVARVIADGKVVASTDAAEAGKPISEPRFLGQTIYSTRKNGDVVSMAPVASTDTYLGVAEVVLSGSSVEHDLLNSLVVETLVRLLGLALFVLLSLVIARIILGPLADLSRAARTISRGNLGARVPTSGRTELATVARAFNEMAEALGQRIGYLTFLAESGALLPTAFRESGDAEPILREFCERLQVDGACLLQPEDREGASVYCSFRGRDDNWKEAATAMAGKTVRPTAVVDNERALMVVPVLGAVFVAARNHGQPFTVEEQQVITNFAFQIGIAADNARLFESQQEALKVKDQFLSIVSHELRTPLTTIKGYAQMLHRKLAEDEETRRFAETIDAQTSKLGRLVDDLLDVTRFSRGQFELKRQHTDLRPILEDVATRFQLVTSHHTVVLDADGGPWEGDWDRDRLEQVLNNLVGNAIKYSPDGGVITIAARGDDRKVVVSVRDEGMGIPPEDQQHLFERFYRGDAERKNIQGLGLGLYVTRRILEAHGGSISVQSEVGRGTEFTFTLPLQRQPAISGAVHGLSAS
jgi:two-component system sensor histidine kinase VicK